ncbi:hypothetical protein [Lactiplantibacillus plantarum]|uniref:hypothetical protein n=1 Tax=Lactiplantibacillus plantarum TaxID=1590 RepID=UPI001599E373|nr:hypothetical protein [Lactiplantibacillus plantarum]QKX09039.1 hypothetical protein Heal19_500433 [Lactiplantibacillus plantarum]
MLHGTFYGVILISFLIGIGVQWYFREYFQLLVFGHSVETFIYDGIRLVPVRHARFTTAVSFMGNWTWCNLCDEPIRVISLCRGGAQ